MTTLRDFATSVASYNTQEYLFSLLNVMLPNRVVEIRVWVDNSDLPYYSSPGKVEVRYWGSEVYEELIAPLAVDTESLCNTVKIKILELLNDGRLTVDWVRSGYNAECVCLAAYHFPKPVLTAEQAQAFNALCNSYIGE